MFIAKLSFVYLERISIVKTEKINVGLNMYNSKNCIKLRLYVSFGL